MRNRKLGRKRWIIPPMIIFLMVTLAVIVITALLAPVIAPIDLGASDLTQRLKMPKFKDPTSPYLFGTDNLGRDVAIRLLYATRSTIMISFTGMIIATVTGTALGILSGLGGKWIDAVLSFFTDVRLSIPTTFIGIIFACILGAKPVTTILVMAITGWSSYCRLVRSQIFQLKNAKFIETDATIMRYDERSIADPLIGSVHDPIYQGAGAYGVAGVPQVKEGAVSKAHGGVLFIDEIGELQTCQINKLLKVLEDRKVMFESAYYSEENKKIPTYIHDVFKNGIPADFRLIGATTRKPEEIPEAVRSRCVEIYFNPLTRDNIEKIIYGAAERIKINIEQNAVEMIARYAKNGRDAVKILQMAKNIIFLDNRRNVTLDDIAWILKTCHYTNGYISSDEKIIDISVIKPK